MLINGVDMNIKLARAPDAFYLLAPLDDNKVRIKLLDATILSLRLNRSPLFYLLTLFWEWNAKLSCYTYTN